MIVICVFLLLINPVHGETTLSSVAPYTWIHLSNGLEYSSLEARVYCESGSSNIVVVRIDPSQWKFSTHHFKSKTYNHMPSSAGWLQNLNAAVVVNAGQFLSDFNHLGWLISKGKNIGTRCHPTWKGIFVSERIRNDIPFAGIIDLEETEMTLNNLPYSEAVQSLMLIDKNGNYRVKSSKKRDRRAAIGEDKNGNILIVVTRGKYILWNFADLLDKSGLNLIKTMMLDGGSQAQLSISVGSNHFNVPDPQIPIPAVISVSARGKN